MRLVIIFLILISCSKNLEPKRKISSEEIPRKFFTIAPEAQKKLKKVDWKETFAKIFAKHVFQDDLKSLIPYPSQLKVKESIYYNSKPFEQIFLEILNEPSSIGVIEKKNKLLSNDRTLENLVRRKFSRMDFYNSGAWEFINLLEEELEKEKGPIGNYFETALGQKIMDILQDTIFIILPGFGNHLIQEMAFPDLVEEINEYYGRSRTRPFIKEGLSEGFLNYKDYYGNPSREIQFDILEPMGKDTGNTFSTHKEISKFLRDWIFELPKFYENKNIVFIGYSKGATLALQILTDYPEIRDRSRAIISLAGPLQGSTYAEFLTKTIYDLSSSEKIDELKEKISKLPQGLEFEDTIKKFAKNGFEQSVFFMNLIEKIPHLPDSMKLTIKGVFEKIFQEDSRVILEGLQEEGTPYMLNWNLKYLNQEYFDRPVALFNLSFLANFKDFLVKGPIGEDGSKIPPEIIPQFTEKGIDTKAFSLDNLSQTIISFNNQELVPGGLMDSMVNWNNSKSPVFDPLPLNRTNPEPVLLNAYQSNDFFKNNFTYEDFKSLPRKDIFRRKGLENMDFVDLGEVRGTHWSGFFRQVLKNPLVEGTPSHQHSFPHKSFMKSIIETYGIYKLIRD